MVAKRTGFVQAQVWPDTASTEAQGGTLERFGRVRLGRNPSAAVSGQYTVTVIGSVGAIVPSQAVFKSNDSALNPGKLFILDNTKTLVTTTDTMLLRSLEGGEGSKLEIGNTLTTVSPIALVNSIVTVAAETIQPLNAETIDAYRALILQSFRLEAQGGAATDYRIWAGDAQGVARVYPYAASGYTNSVNLFVEATLVDSTDGKGTPTQAILDDVASVVNFNPDTTLTLNERGRRPLTVVIFYLPVTIVTVDIIITGFTGITVTQQSLLLSALTNFIAQIRPYVAAAEPITSDNSILSVNNITGVIFAQIPAAIFTSATLKINGIATPSFTFVNGNIPWLSTITYN